MKYLNTGLITFGILCVLAVSFNTPNREDAERIMLKYGRQIPTAPISGTIMWHLQHGD